MSGGTARRGRRPLVRRVFWWPIAVVGGFLTVATLAGFFGSLGWPFDLANSFRPQYAAVLVALGFVAILLRRPGGAVVLILGGLINAGLVAPYVLGSGSDPSTPGTRLTVVSFNVGVSNPNRSEVTSYLADGDADVVFLLESSFEWEDAIARQGIPMAPVAIVPEGRVAGITILADPAMRPRMVPTGLGPVDQAAAVELTIDGTTVVVLGLHPPSPVSRSRAEARDALLADAGRWIAERGGRLIVVGDLNATPWSAAYRGLRWRGRLRDTLVGSGLQPTWPAGWGPLMVPIDHALHTDGLATIERGTGPSLGSAHRSLIVTFAVAA